MSEGGRRRCTESVTCRGQSDIQLIISGNCPARGVLSACESTLVVIRSGRVAERAGWQEGRRGARCVEPKRRATTGVAAGRRCTSLVDRRGRELGGGSRLGSAEAAAATGGGGRQVRLGFSSYHGTVLTRSPTINKLMSFYEFIQIHDYLPYSCLTLKPTPPSGSAPTTAARRLCFRTDGCF